MTDEQRDRALMLLLDSIELHGKILKVLLDESIKKDKGIFADMDEDIEKFFGSIPNVEE